MLEDRPTHVRKSIALIITAGIGVILLLVLIIVYTTKKDTSATPEAGSKLKNFYTTISKSGQFIFGTK